MEVTSMSQHTTEVLWQCWACLVGSGIPKPTHLTLCPHISRSSSRPPRSSSPNRAGKNLFCSASSMGPMYCPTPGTVHCRPVQMPPVLQPPMPTSAPAVASTP
eukprot:11399394-Ditylum_brightwellii.AAC.1